MADKKISELVDGGNISSGDYTIITRNNQNYKVDLNQLKDDTNTFTTGSTLSGTTAIFFRNDGNNYNLQLSGLTVWEKGSDIEEQYAIGSYRQSRTLYCTFIADNIGSIGNSIQLVGNGSLTISQLVLNWNTNNINNTITPTYYNGGDNLVLTLNEIIQFEGGSDARILSSNYQTVGTECVASSDYSVAEGSNTMASGVASHAEGYGTIASGDYSHAEGYGTIASGDYLHAEGYGTIANGNYSHAEGNSTQANGVSSHAEGNSTVANGVSSHAEGNYTQTNGNYSHAEGTSTVASGAASHAEGDRTIANGVVSHAEGWYTQANGFYSHAEGSFTTAHDFTEHVGGQYNIIGTGSTSSWVSTENLFTLGNGADENNRSNAFQIKKDGTIIITTPQSSTTNNILVVENDGTVKSKILNDIYTTGVTLSGTTAIFTRNDSNTYQLDLNGLGGLGIVNKTYSELKTMYDGSTLIPGQYYKITDFKTLHNILDETDTYTGDSWEGSLEPLILLSTSNNTFDKQVYSESYPKDIIYYDININNFDSDPSFFNTGTKGVITYRKDTVQNVECWYDFRNVKYYRNENLVYTFGDYANCFNTSIGKRITNTILNNTVFSTYALGCIFGYDNYNNTFDEVCYNNIIGNNFYGNTILTYFYNNIIGNNFNDNTIGNYFYDNKIFSNNFNSNIISDYFYNNTINNDFSNNEISIYFRFNDVKNNVDSVDFTNATHVYGDYNCDIFVNEGSSLRLKYIDSNDNDIITDLIPLDELLFRTNATSFTPTITKSGSTITWVLDGENIVKSSGQELLYTYPTNSLKNVKMKIDNFDNVYNLDFSNCGISETLNLTNFKNISKYYLHQNNLTSLILPNSSNVISAFYVYSNPSLTTLNLSGLTGLGRDIRLYSNNSLTSIILPVSTQRILKFQAYGCSNLGYVNFNPLSGSSSSGITMLLDNNNWSSAIVNHVLVDLDQIGWSGGTLSIGGNNASPDTTSGGYNGTQAATNLGLKYWNISI